MIASLNLNQQHLFLIELLVFVVLLVVYLSKSSLVQSSLIQIVALGFFFHLLHTSIKCDTKPIQEPLAPELLDPNPDDVYDRTEVGDANEHVDTATTWYEGTTNLGATYTSSNFNNIHNNNQDFWSSMVGSSLSKSRAPVSSRSYSNFNKFHSYD